MQETKDQIERFLHEDLKRLLITAGMVVVALVAVTLLQDRYGVLNAVVVLPEESLTNPAAAAPPGTPEATPAALSE